MNGYWQLTSVNGGGVELRQGDPNGNNSLDGYLAFIDGTFQAKTYPLFTFSNYITGASPPLYNSWNSSNFSICLDSQFIQGFGHSADQAIILNVFEFDSNSSTVTAKIQLAVPDINIPQTLNVHITDSPLIVKNLKG